MKTNQNQLKQEAHAGNPNRPHFQTSLFLQTGKQFRWFALAACAVIVTVLCLAAFVQPAAAQDVFGRISGTVTDTQGAVIPDATITITNEQTQLSRTLKTDAHGFYVTDDLPVGMYTVSASAQQGFKAFKKTGNDLSAGARLTVDMKLEVGSNTQVVEVTASGETVNTVSGELARTVDSQQVQNLALNERNYVQLVSLVPGAALTAFDQTSLTTGMSTTSSSVNGRRADGNNFTVDGGFNLDSGSNATQLDNVGIDFIQQVSIKTSNFSAEYGRNSGASVNVVTRSGGNQFHGTAFEYLRNNVFDAIPPNNKVNIPPGTPTKNLESILRYNDFGWNFGGPIIHKKLFFFVGEEWKRIRQLAASQKLTIPTTAELAGNFSASGLTPAQSLKLPTAPGSLPPGCTLIAPNVLSPQCITPDGAAIAAVYAKMATVASTFSNAVQSQNALFQPNDPQNWREDIVRLDYQLNSAHSIYGRYIHDDLNLIDAFGTFVPGGSLPTTPTNRIRPGYSYQVADVWIINPHLINEAKFNVSWNKQRIPPSGNLWERSTYGFQFTPPFGFVGTFPNGIPHISFTGIGNGAPTAGPAQLPGPFFSLLAPTVDISPSDNLTWTLGSHTLKFGVMYARNRKDQNSRTDSYNGRINFQAAGNPNTTNDPFADALLGNYQSFSQQSADPVGHFRYNNTEAYINDNWKVTRNLSLEAGLRYQYIGPTYLQGNNVANFDPALYVPLSASVLTNAPGSTNFNSIVPGTPFLDNGYLIDGLVRPGSVPADQLVRVPGGNSAFVQAVPAGGSRGLYGGKNLFAPRFGFSFSPFSDDKTVIRGGFGIFYDKPEGNIIFGQTGVVPFLQSVQFNNGNLAAFTPSAAAAGVAPTTFGMSAVDPNFKNAMSMQYSFGLQHELPYGVLAEVNYVGNQGRHEVRQPNINVPTFAVVTANGPGVKTNQERPFIGYQDITQFRSDSNSNYNALQFFATKRKGNLLATVSYTWSRVLGDTGGINDNPEPECAFTCVLPNGQAITWRQFNYGPLSFDRQHIFVVTYNYEFPFFRSQQGPIGVLLGGWQLGGITRAQTGQPLTVTAGNLPVGNLSFTRRADFVPGAPLYSGYTCPSVTKCWFNPGIVTDPISKAKIFNPNTFLTSTTTDSTGAVVDPGLATRVGDAPTGNIIGPAYYDWDISVRKRFNLPREGMGLLFQADFFNAFNRANWGNPGTSASGGLGIINSAAPPRQLQFGLKFAF